MSDWVRQLGHDLDWSVQPVSPEWTLELCREKVGEEPVAWAVARAYENAQRVARFDERDLPPVRCRGYLD